MQNFLTYRIAATLQLIAFFTIALFVFEPVRFHGPPFSDPWPDYFSVPVILLMLITLLNDGTMIAIGYDNVKPSTRPEKWNLPALFLVSSVLGFVSCLSSLILLGLCLDSHSPTSLIHRMGLPKVMYGKIVMMVYLKVRLR